MGSRMVLLGRVSASNDNTGLVTKVLVFVVVVKSYSNEGVGLRRSSKVLW
jgi:hypothetical protein